MTTKSIFRRTVSAAAISLSALFVGCAGMPGPTASPEPTARESAEIGNSPVNFGEGAVVISARDGLKYGFANALVSQFGGKVVAVGEFDASPDLGKNCRTGFGWVVDLQPDGNAAQTRFGLTSGTFKGRVKLAAFNCRAGTATATPGEVSIEVSILNPAELNVTNGQERAGRAVAQALLRKASR